MVLTLWCVTSSWHSPCSGLEVVGGFCHGRAKLSFPEGLHHGKTSSTHECAGVSIVLAKARWSNTQPPSCLCVTFQHWPCMVCSGTTAGKGIHPASICCWTSKTWGETGPGRGSPLKKPPASRPECLQKLRAVTCIIDICWNIGNISSASYMLPVAAPGSDWSLAASRAVWRNTTACCPVIILIHRHQSLAALRENQHIA